MKKIKMFAKSISLILALVMFLGSGFPACAKTAVTSGKCGKKVYWKYKNGTIKITGKGTMKNYKISEVTEKGNRPWEQLIEEEKITKVIVGDRITTVGDCAFTGANVFKIKLGKRVKSIGKEAFAYQQEGAVIEKLVLPNSITTIKAGAFEESCICNIKWSKNLRVIGAYAFQKDWESEEGGLQEETIVFPSKVSSIGNCAFYGNSVLKNVTFGKNVKKIGDGAFDACSKLRKAVIRNKRMKIEENNFQLNEYEWEGEEDDNGGEYYTVPNPKLTIYGYRNSTAYKFAKYSGLKFKRIK